MAGSGSANNRDRAEETAREASVQPEFVLPSRNPVEDMAFFTNALGFRLESIFPADNPAVAVLSGHGVRLRLDRGAAGEPVTIRLLSDDVASVAGGRTELTAPCGVRIEIAEAHPPLRLPPIRHSLVVSRLDGGAGWVTGRAGMLYRDLVPGRLGGHMVASHIRIPDGGPVPDMVHFHTVSFQMIFCYRGRVRLVYEDQGPPFIMEAGDCVLQPPEIRHRVLEASDGLEVVELAVPAEHVTAFDHDMALPTPDRKPDRDFGGQRFCLHRAAEAAWKPWRIAGFEACDTGIAAATGGRAAVTIARRCAAGDAPATVHDADILFTFVLKGTMTLDMPGRDPQSLGAGDAFVIPPGTPASCTNCSADLELMEAALPGAFRTKLHAET